MHNEIALTISFPVFFIGTVRIVNDAECCSIAISKPSVVGVRCCISAKHRLTPPKPFKRTIHLVIQIEVCHRSGVSRD